jgi:hypothetical protein
LHWNPTPKPNSWKEILQILERNPPNRDRSGSHIAMELSKFARNEAHASAHQSEPNSLLSLSLSRQNLSLGWATNRTIHPSLHSSIHQSMHSFIVPSHPSSSPSSEACLGATTSVCLCSLQEWNCCLVFVSFWQVTGVKGFVFFNSLRH